MDIAEGIRHLRGLFGDCHGISISSNWYSTKDGEGESMALWAHSEGIAYCSSLTGKTLSEAVADIKRQIEAANRKLNAEEEERVA